MIKRTVRGRSQTDDEVPKKHLDAKFMFLHSEYQQAISLEKADNVFFFCEPFILLKNPFLGTFLQSLFADLSIPNCEFYAPFIFAS